MLTFGVNKEQEEQDLKIIRETVSKHLAVQQNNNQKSGFTGADIIEIIKALGFPIFNDFELAKLALNKFGDETLTTFKISRNIYLLLRGYTAKQAPTKQPEPNSCDALSKSNDDILMKINSQVAEILTSLNTSKIAGDSNQKTIASDITKSLQVMISQVNYQMSSKIERIEQYVRSIDVKSPYDVEVDQKIDCLSKSVEYLIQMVKSKNDVKEEGNARIAAIDTVPLDDGQKENHLKSGSSGFTDEMNAAKKLAAAAVTFGNKY